VPAVQGVQDGVELAGGRLQARDQLGGREPQQSLDRLVAGAEHAGGDTRRGVGPPAGQLHRLHQGPGLALDPVRLGP